MKVLVRRPMAKHLAIIENHSTDSGANTHVAIVPWISGSGPACF
jgi:hypothetical protein